MTNTVFNQIRTAGIVPVIAIDNADHAAPLADALRAGGLYCAEVTFRTQAAEQAIRNLTAAAPDMLVCAGTVLTTQQVDRAVDAGAQMIVSPGLNPKVVRYCQSKGVPIIPGCATPGEIEAALDLGISTVKFFPAEAAGGLPMMKAMSAPYGGIKFMPTGGINEKNLNEYLKFDKVLACGGSWMVKSHLIREERFDEIRALTAAAVQTMHGFTLRHVGIPAPTSADAESIVNTLAAFGLDVNSTGASLFAGKMFEVMLRTEPNDKGHIALGCNDLPRAVDYLRRKGVIMDPDSARCDADGRLVCMDLKNRVGGLRLRLCLNE